jgi:hypothetical protein
MSMSTSRSDASPDPRDPSLGAERAGVNPREVLFQFLRLLAQCSSEARSGAHSLSNERARRRPRDHLPITPDALRSGLRERRYLSRGKASPASGSGTPLRSASIQSRTPTVSPVEREARNLGETAARSAASGGSPTHKRILVIDGSRQKHVVPNSPRDTSS